MDDIINSLEIWPLTGRRHLVAQGLTAATSSVCTIVCTIIRVNIQTKMAVVTAMLYALWSLLYPDKTVI